MTTFGFMCWDMYRNHSQQIAAGICLQDVTECVDFPKELEPDLFVHIIAVPCM
jgi:hypothetical protein